MSTQREIIMHFCRLVGAKPVIIDTGVLEHSLRGHLLEGEFEDDSDDRINLLDQEIIEHDVVQLGKGDIITADDIDELLLDIESEIRILSNDRTTYFLIGIRYSDIRQLYYLIWKS